ncbi:GNAT family N-acetyltransferase [Kribbella sp. NPDC023855]|uniref:GNAT family N-acetyltransferase n=1 Tax=Kribbella sp. NPDC023855 TaxID=3154698 RepID=UPI0033C3863C
MIAAYNSAVVGFADTTLEEVAYCIGRPGFDPATDGWLVVGDDGRPAGYATARGVGDWRMIDVEVTSQYPEVAGWLVDRTVERAREMGRERGHEQVTADLFVYRADEVLRTQLADHDFATGTTYHRMRIDHTGPVAAPDEPAGVLVRRGAFDEVTRSAAHAAITECFTGQFGWVETPRDEWVEGLEDVPIFDWSQLTLLEVDGRTVAVRVCSDSYVESENCGLIGMLGVVEEFRGRGLAKYLLRDAFAVDAAAGRVGTILHVDTNNPTPALGLYLSVGMKPTVIFDGWRRVLPAA